VQTDGITVLAKQLSHLLLGKPYCLMVEPDSESSCAVGALVDDDVVTGIIIHGSSLRVRAENASTERDAPLR
jgi:hypothetical protein